jgi:hypothetical protein
MLSPPKPVQKPKTVPDPAKPFQKPKTGSDAAKPFDPAKPFWVLFRAGKEIKKLPDADM